MRAPSSPPSRISLHAMAYRTRFTVTMGRSFRHESSKNLHQIGNLTTKRHHPITPSQMGRLKMLSSQQRPAKASGQDPYLAILDWRNTPSASIGTSPVQRLFGRRTKTLLPTAGKLLQPKIVEGTEEKLKERKLNQEHYYNRGTRELVDLQSGDTVRIRPFPTDREKLWKKATVIKQVAPRSYEVDLQGKVYRRNRRHLVKTSESSPPKFEPDISLPTEEMQPSTSEEASNSSEPLEQAQGSHPVASESLQGTPVMCTRSGRTVRLPKRFQDYV